MKTLYWDKNRLATVWKTLIFNSAGSAEETAQLRYSGQPNTHLHGGIGVTSKSPFYKQTK